MIRRLVPVAAVVTLFSLAACGKLDTLTNADGGCNAPLVKGPETPMIHVWIKKNVCGPFAALEGVGAGQVPPGQTKLCDHAHGSA